ncbi:hypothetical protein SAMN05443662_0063 [Sulfurivirga caldicuralii]|uniref:Uncharacterized protein n=1 Tax=Sulfurivirga caldicuralii TaxID=364032 RepID=A0A1N6DDX5_9GAMM|nr:hypothetical protein [Sulfurivirga caldicuralii]SIN68873.1 hypothetical protein SAMN05443662_0063 [Sulfurivirga caldicuralii]
MGGRKRLHGVFAVLALYSLIGCSYFPGDKKAPSAQAVQAQGGAFEVTVSQTLPDETQMPQAQAALEKQAVTQLQKHFLEEVIQAEQERLQAHLSLYEKRLLGKMAWRADAIPPIELPTFMAKVTYKEDTLKVTKEVDRAALAKILAERIAKIDQVLLAYRFVPDSQPRLVQIQYLLPAYPLLLERQLYERVLQRLPMDYDRRVQDIYATTLLGKLQTLMRKFTIEVRANLSKDATVETGLRTLLAEQGLNLQGMPDVFVLYDAQRQVTAFNGGVEVTVQGRISLADANEVPFAQFNYHVRKQGTTAQTAETKAIRAITEKTLHHLDNLLLKRFYILQGVYQK